MIPDRGLRAPPGRGAYLWSRLGTLEAPGGFLALEDLPPGDVRVLAFRDDASARSVSLRLDPRRTARVTLDLRTPATDAGAPERDALDPLGRLLLALGEDAGEVFTRPLAGR